MVSPNDVDFRKDGAAGKAVGVVFYVWDWVAFRDGAIVQSSVGSTGPPTAVLEQGPLEADSFTPSLFAGIPRN